MWQKWTIANLIAYNCGKSIHSSSCLPPMTARPAEPCAGKIHTWKCKQLPVPWKGKERYQGVDDLLGGPGEFQDWCALRPLLHESLEDYSGTQSIAMQLLPQSWTSFPSYVTFGTPFWNLLWTRKANQDICWRWAVTIQNLPWHDMMIRFKLKNFPRCWTKVLWQLAGINYSHYST